MESNGPGLTKIPTALHSGRKELCLLLAPRHRGVGASQYGIGMVAARRRRVRRDEHAVFPVGSHNQHYGVALSLPVSSGARP
jgi:hypothetical protein